MFQSPCSLPRRAACSPWLGCGDGNTPMTT